MNWKGTVELELYHPNRSITIKLGDLTLTTQCSNPETYKQLKEYIDKAKGNDKD